MTFFRSAKLYIFFTTTFINFIIFYFYHKNVAQCDVKKVLRNCSGLRQAHWGKTIQTAHGSHDNSWLGITFFENDSILKKFSNIYNYVSMIWFLLILQTCNQHDFWNFLAPTKVKRTRVTFRYSLFLIFSLQCFAFLAYSWLMHFSNNRLIFKHK